MKADLRWILRKNFIVAPVVLLVLMLAIAACGSDPTASPTATQAPTEVIPPTAMPEAAMADEDEVMEDEAMADEDQIMDDDAMADGGEIMDDDAMMESGTTLKLDFSGVQPLAGGYHYKGWEIIDGNPVSTGKFNIGPNGELFALDRTAKTNGVFHSDLSLETATAVVITI